MKKLILNEHGEIPLAAFLVKCGLINLEEGRCVWDIMANRDLEVDDLPLENGSFRTLGGIIASVCGGDYMDYYCSYEDSSDVDEVWAIMKANGATILNDDDEDVTYYWARRG